MTVHNFIEDVNLNQVEVERTVLGLILRQDGAYDQVRTSLDPDDFQVPANRNLYLAMGNHGSDLIKLATAGVAGWDAASLSELLDCPYFSTALDSSVRIIKERSILIKISAHARMISDSAASRSTSMEDAKILIEQLNEVMESGKSQSGELKHVSKSTEEVLAALRGEERRFFPTNIGKIDRVITGLFRGDFILLGGRPSMGKTALAMHILRTMATCGYPVGIFSMEMSRSALAERDLAFFSGVDSSRIRAGKINPDEMAMVQSAVETLNKLPIYVDDQPALTVKELHYRAKQFVRKHSGRVIAVDYLQLASGDGNNDNARVSAISRSLKSMARELNVPVLVLSQLNRSLEQRQDKRPMLSDLRDSGSLEQDADVIMFIYRDGAYSVPKQTCGPVEVIVSKQRCGPLGVAELYFNGKDQSFR